MVDIQYLLTLSPRLDRFKKKSNNLYNFRCPYCGDSQKKQSKARGFVYSMKNEYSSSATTVRRVPLLVN